MVELSNPSYDDVVPNEEQPGQLDAKIEQARKEIAELQERIRHMVARRERIRQEASKVEGSQRPGEK